LRRCPSLSGRRHLRRLERTSASVMIEKFALPRSTPTSEFLDLNHTGIINSLVSFRSRSSFNPGCRIRRTSRSGH
jgi:hypothetical protein